MTRTRAARSARIRVKLRLRSLFELKNVSTTQPTELYFGPTGPAGHENQWIKTIPRKGWFVYFRVYGPEQAAFDGSWKPGDFEERGSEVESEMPAARLSA